MWVSAKETAVIEEDKALLLTKLRDHAISELPSGVNISFREDDAKATANSLLGAWQDMVNVNHDLLQHSLENGTKEGLLHVKGPPDLHDFAASYDVVFVASTGADAFHLRPTRYGQGVLCHKVGSMPSLRRDAKANEDGAIQLSLGVAFRFQALEHLPPFRPAAQQKHANQKKGNKASKDEQKANKKKVAKVKAGFDFVVPVEEDGEPAESRRIYWIPGAVLKLCVLDLQLEERKECPICGDEVPASDGYLCDNDEAHGEEKHFTCNDCFGGHLQSKVSDELRLRRASNGHVYCPVRRKAADGKVLGCPGSKPISEAAILKHAPTLFDAFLKHKQELLEITLRATITEEQRKLFQMEQERLARMGEQERVINKHRTHVVEEILTLKCPRAACHAAFLDFEGCFALKCGQCNCGFCGWCLADCGVDAHAHVAQCPTKIGGGGDYFGTAAQFVAVHKPRRETLARDYFASIAEPEVREKVMALCRKDFEELGMHAVVRDIAAAVGHHPLAAAGQEEQEGHLRFDEQLAIALQAAEDEEDEIEGEAGEEYNDALEDEDEEDEGW